MFREIFFLGPECFIWISREFCAHQKSTRSSWRFYFWRKTQRQNSKEKRVTRNGREMKNPLRTLLWHWTLSLVVLFYSGLRSRSGPHCGTHNSCVVRSSSPLSVRERMEKMQEVKASSIVEMFALCRCCCFYFVLVNILFFFCLKEIFSFQHWPLLRDLAYHVRPAAMHCMWCNDRRSRSCVLSHRKDEKSPCVFRDDDEGIENAISKSI